MRLDKFSSHGDLSTRRVKTSLLAFSLREKTMKLTCSGGNKTSAPVGQVEFWSWPGIYGSPTCLLCIMRSSGKSLSKIKIFLHLDATVTITIIIISIIRHFFKISLYKALSLYDIYGHLSHVSTKCSTKHLIGKGGPQNLCWGLNYYHFTFLLDRRLLIRTSPVSGERRCPEWKKIETVEKSSCSGTCCRAASTAFFHMALLEVFTSTSESPPQGRNTNAGRF